MTKKQMLQYLDYSWVSAVRGKRSGSNHDYFQGQIDLINDFYGYFGCSRRDGSDEKILQFRNPASIEDCLLSGEWNRIV